MTASSYPSDFNSSRLYSTPSAAAATTNPRAFAYLSYRFLKQPLNDGRSPRDGDRSHVRCRPIESGAFAFSTTSIRDSIFSRVIGCFLVLLLNGILLFIGFADRILGRIFFNLPKSVLSGIIEDKLKESLTSGPA